MQSHLLRKILSKAGEINPQEDLSRRRRRRRR